MLSKNEREILGYVMLEPSIIINVTKAFVK
jgi:hypothetical protein